MDTKETSLISGGDLPLSLNTSGNNISFHGITYTVTQGLFKKKSKIILNNIS